MDSPNQYTDLARAAIADAQTKAHASSNAQLFPVHVALAIFEDKRGNTGLGRRILIKLGVDEARLGAALRRVLLKLPTQSPAPAKASIHGSGELQSFLDDAARLREDNKDSHVAVDHLLLALYKRRNLAAELEGLRSALARPQRVPNGVHASAARAPTSESAAEGGVTRRGIHPLRRRASESAHMRRWGGGF